MTVHNFPKPWLPFFAVLLAIMGIFNLHNSHTFSRALALTEEGQTLEASGNIQGALNKYKEAVKLHPNAAYFHALLGNAYHKLGEDDKALGAYDAALKISPQHFWVHYQIGILYRDEHRYNDAIKKFKELILMKDNWYGSNKTFHYTQYQNLAYVQLGYCYAKLGASKESIAAYKN